MKSSTFNLSCPWFLQSQWFKNKNTENSSERVNKASVLYTTPYGWLGRHTNSLPERPPEQTRERNLLFFMWSPQTKHVKYFKFTRIKHNPQIIFPYFKNVCKRKPLFPVRKLTFCPCRGQHVQIYSTITKTVFRQQKNNSCPLTYIFFSSLSLSMWHHDDPLSDNFYSSIYSLICPQIYCVDRYMRNCEATMLI